MTKNAPHPSAHSRCAGFDEEGLLVLDEEQRLVAAPVRPSDDNEVAPGQWYSEARFGVLEELEHSTNADLDAAQEGIAQHLAGRR